ncbi:sensor histidine kinase [Novosphingobium terrae]|uniref:sensor histidine kinase n=1 Tax=Novosphingobium terrae TaxID=2726189 RepID=UPI001981C745|nr:ATP-binding protein [Novosphingobium terrae]
MPQGQAAQRRFRRSLMRFMGLGFAALLGVVISAGVLMAMNQRQTRLIAHTYQVQSQIIALRLASTRLVAANLRRNQDLTIESEGPLTAARTQLDQSIARLATLTADNPRQQARIPLLTAIAAQIEVQAGLPAPGAMAPGGLIDRPNNLIFRITRAMQAHEEQLLAYRDASQRGIERGFYVTLGITGLLLVAMGTLTFTTIQTYTREIDAQRQALRMANTGLEAAVQERTAELKRANSEIQRFAYIVSHDLRSPLVNVMGFTAEMEIATQTLTALLDEAQAQRPDTIAPATDSIIREDLPQAIRFIRSSTEKMDRLINAILRLSRLGRREIAPEWLDMNALVQGVVDTLHMRIEESGAQVEIASPLPRLFSDRMGLEQMIANLVENALKYGAGAAPPQIRISGREIGERIEISVADQGRGIDPRDHERVFDLFRRSGQQDRPGEGIGLAHVRALAYRLDGTVMVDSTLGKGATFTINLPRHHSGSQSQS